MFDNYSSKIAAEEARTNLPRIVPDETVFNVAGESFSTVQTFYVAKPVLQPNLWGKTYKVFPGIEEYESFRNSSTHVPDAVLTVTPLSYPFSSRYLQISRSFNCKIETAKERAPPTEQHNQSTSNSQSDGRDPIETSAEANYTYCTIHATRMFGSFVRRFTFDFQPDPRDASTMFKVVMFVHNYSTYADTVYKGTRIRWTGTTPINSPVSNNEYSMILLRDDEPSLLDGMDEKTLRPNSKLLSLSNIFLPRFMKGIFNKEMEVYQNAEVPTRIREPFAIFTRLQYDKCGFFDLFSNVRKVNKIQVRALPQLQSNEDSLVIVCMSILLRYQEKEKQTRSKQVLRNLGLRRLALPGAQRQSYAGIAAVEQHPLQWMENGIMWPLEAIPLHRPNI